MLQVCSSDLLNLFHLQDKSFCNSEGEIEKFNPETPSNCWSSSVTGFFKNKATESESFKILSLFIIHKFVHIACILLAFKQTNHPLKYRSGSFPFVTATLDCSNVFSKFTEDSKK